VTDPHVYISYDKLPTSIESFRTRTMRGRKEAAPSCADVEHPAENGHPSARPPSSEGQIDATETR